ALWTAMGKRPWTIVPYGDSILMTERNFTLEAGGEVQFFNAEEGGRIVGIEMERTGQWGRTVWLDAQWDSDKTPAISAPVDDLFGYAFGSPAAQSLLLGSFRGRDYCYLPMPFERKAVIKLRSLNKNGSDVAGTLRVYYARTPLDKNSEGRLYTIARQEQPAKGKPYTIAEVHGKGHYVGTLLQAQGLKPGITVFFEGDDVATADGKMIMHGTGSEDYFNGGWYWILDRWDKGVSLPLHGALDYSLPHGRTGGYRFYLGDKVPFGQDFNLTIEHGPEGNAVGTEYTSVAFYYGAEPPAPVVQTATPQYSPSVFEFYPRDFPIQIGPGTTVHFPGHNTMEIKAGIQTEDFKVDDSDKVEAKGMVRADLSAVPPGRYRILVSYQRHPEGSAFSLWRRQQQLTGWIDTEDKIRSDVTRAFLANVTLTDQVRSLTFRTRPSGDGGSVLRLDRLILERVEPD
ncbi:MAG TPA: glycoside hydrolase family 172 protein, partial [Ohtaekwangia sp.]|nr:glycoside hydrolase family 172 protein [Ohtaekwangia sp.]